MLPNPEKTIIEKEEIPPVKVFKSTQRIKLGETTYPLIMCYLCPLCEQPLLAYWKLNKKPRVTNRIVGRALRDSGFGAYRFFEEENGQGFEYDPEKDPKKRHYHQKQSEAYYSDEIIQSYMIFMELNPIVTVNGLLHIMLNRGEFKTLFEKGHQFLSDQSLAMKFIEVMRTKTEYFLVINDIISHGKPIFYLDIIKWQKRFDRWDDEYAGIEKSIRIFGKPLLKQLNYADKAEYIKESYFEAEPEEES